MTKIMLVEDDNNLREIYEARLLAEGYEIVSAKDGEEALAMAVKEKPDLIISDVMMPKISGFDMLDILRSTPETKNTKVIMMTALSQAEDKTRADKLGADRYLVKSQVTLEDVAKVAREVLSGEAAPAPTAAPAAPADPVAATTSPPSSPDPATPDPAAQPAAPDPVPADNTTQTDTARPKALTDSPEADLSQPASGTVAEALANAIEPSSSSDAFTKPAEPGASSESAIQPKAKEGELAEAVNNIVKNTEPPMETKPEQSTDSGGVPVTRKKVIEPINDLSQKGPDINELLAKEEQKASDSPAPAATDAATVVQPDGTSITPATPGTPADQKQPGNVVNPGIPGDVAL